MTSAIVDAPLLRLTINPTKVNGLKKPAKFRLTEFSRFQQRKSGSVWKWTVSNLSVTVSVLPRLGYNPDIYMLFWKKR